MTRKLYCYVDETGQDTKGKLFIVVAIVVEKDRENIIAQLEQKEKQAGKIRAKWLKTKKEIKSKYLDSVLSLKSLKKKIYYEIFEESKLYQDLTALAIAKAINHYVEHRDIKNYQASIFIDGLSKNQEKKVSKALRGLGIKTRKVRGIQDEASAIIRLADSLVGMIREIDEGENKFSKFKKTMTKLD